jgi:hypothetical protein
MPQAWPTKVAGGKWRFEEATPITIYAPANPTDPGDAADPSTPQGISKFFAEYASRYARLRTRLSLRELASRRQIKIMPGAVSKPAIAEKCNCFLPFAA